MISQVSGFSLKPNLLNLFYTGNVELKKDLVNK